MERSLEVARATIDGMRRMAEGLLVLMSPVLGPLIFVFLLLSPLILILEIIWLVRLLTS